MSSSLKRRASPGFPIASANNTSISCQSKQATVQYSRTIEGEYIEGPRHPADEPLVCRGHELHCLPHENGQECGITEDQPAHAAMKNILDEEDPETQVRPPSPPRPVVCAS